MSAIVFGFIAMSCVAVIVIQLIIRDEERR